MLCALPQLRIRASSRRKAGSESLTRRVRRSLIPSKAFRLWTCFALRRSPAFAPHPGAKRVLNPRYDKPFSFCVYFVFPAGGRRRPTVCAYLLRIARRASRAPTPTVCVCLVHGAWRAIRQSPLRVWHDFCTLRLLFCHILTADVFCAKMWLYGSGITEKH